MSLDFQEDNKLQQFRSRVILGQAQRPKMLDLVLKTGIAKTENGAASVLMVAAALIFGISIFIFMGGTRSSTQVAPPIMYPDGTMAPVVR